MVVTTDRQSAFDRLLASIPFKGQVLNQTAAWWFSQTGHIIPNAVLDVPDPNITVMKKCSVFPVEFVVRGFLTGEFRTDASRTTTSASVYKGSMSSMANCVSNSIRVMQAYLLMHAAPTFNVDSKQSHTSLPHTFIPQK